MLGRLTLDALPSDIITIGGALSMVLGAVTVVALLTYFKKWRWLWSNYLTSLDHKKIGVMYLVVATVMLARGAGDAALMRAQQALASGGSSGILSADTFQQIFSAHGTIMIFFMAMGLMFGIINLILPLQIGSRDVAFPFMNNLSFWLFAVGALLVNLSLVVGEFSAAGWLSYPPLSGLEYSPGVGVDYWLWAIQISGIGSLMSGINFLVTILKMRAPGMSLMKMPIFVWSVLVSMVLVIFAFPILTGTLAMLALDRTMGMHFFTSDMGGNPMMYVNLIWAWGHPEVYILVIPAFGIFSEIVATYARKRLFGYTTMVAALFAITFLSFVVWLHHFFTMGAGGNVNAFFGIMTMVIAVPTGVKIFNWLFTLYRGKLSFKSPLVWFIGFVITFTIGGVTGVMLAVPAVDFQVHNSLFLVAHFHNVIIGGVVFGYIAGIIHWFPKMFGFKLHDGLGKVAAYLWTVGFFTAFTPLYILGLMGATRRMDSYAETAWQPLFIMAGFGSAIIACGFACIVLQIAYSIWRRKELADTTGDPWDGRTLEWSIPSPAPLYNFKVIPTVTHRDQFWEDKQSGKKHRLELSDIHMPKNTPYGLHISITAFTASFGIIWHIWWLAGISLVVSIILLIIRLTDDNTEYVITKEQLMAGEA